MAQHTLDADCLVSWFSGAHDGPSSTGRSPRRCVALDVQTRLDELRGEPAGNASYDDGGDPTNSRIAFHLRSTCCDRDSATIRSDLIVRVFRTSRDVASLAKCFTDLAGLAASINHLGGDRAILIGVGRVFGRQGAFLNPSKTTGQASTTLIRKSASGASRSWR